MVVVKIGGSLLTLPDLGSRIEILLQSRPEIRPVLVVGGGLSADAVRTFGRGHLLSEESCHRLALEAMNVTAHLVAELIPRTRLVDCRREADACWPREQIPIVRMQAWLQHPESQADELPQTWVVTSDSLAAWLAIRWQTDELWLLKSADLPPDITAAEATRRELVDDFFPHIAAQLCTIRWCNLRDDSPRLIEWCQK